MYVLHVVRQFSPAIGGLEEAVGKLATELAQQEDIRSGVLTLDRLFTAPETKLPHRDTMGAVDITRIGFAGSRRYPLAPQVIAHLRHADIVHVHAIDFFFDYLALTRPLHRRPLVASTHGGFFHTDFAGRAKRIWFDKITRRSARRYDRICASSASDARAFASIAPDNLVTIENGVDIDKWRDRASATPTRTMLVLGRFSVNKRVPEVIALLRALRRDDPRWTLIIAGMPSDLSADDLVQAARVAEVAEHVTILVGATDAALAEVIGRASYIVSASGYEGFGLSVVEGMSAGLQPILSDIPPFRALVEATGCGLIVDFGAPDAAVAAIRRFGADGEARHAARRADAMRASERYGWKDAAARFAAVYRSIRTAVRG